RSFRSFPGNAPSGWKSRADSLVANRYTSMLLGRVIGTLVACEVYQGLEGVPMLVVQPLTKSREPKGETIICADSTSMAGPDELVYYEGGREAAMTLRETFVPVDHAIVGIVDDVNLATGPVEK